MSKNFTTPVGRLVAGSPYTPNTTDAEGHPLVIKNGPNAGQPRVDYFLAVAIPKTPGVDWKQEPWGQIIVSEAQAGFPQGQFNQPDFAWKIIDGDSQVPNCNGRKPCDQIGYPDCWVLKFSGGFAPRLFNADGTQQLTEPNAIKCGYYVQINADVDGNGSLNKPGIYLNHRMVALAGYGEEIASGPNATEVGFGGQTLPAGASSTPVSGGFNPAPQVGQGGPGGNLPGQTPQMPQPSAPAPAAPNPQFLEPPQPAAPQMTPAATHTYEQYRAAGWTDDMLVAKGLMTR